MIRMACSMATTTWNSIDHVDTFLHHYRALGFDRVLVMDFDSTDGTRDILTARKWQGFVELVPFPGIASFDSSNDMLSIARQRSSLDSWCLFCDPDELLVTPSMKSHELAPEGEGDSDAELVSIPRFNVTAPLSVARDENQRMSALDALTLRIDGRHRRSIDQAIPMDTLDPPWIFTDIPGKVLVRLDAATSIGDGDHVAHTSHNRSATVRDGTYLLHFPFRTYEAFVNKIELARVFYAAYPDLPPHFGWQLKRWIRLADARKLHEEYLQQFIPDEDVERHLQNRVLFQDKSVLTFHQRHA